MEIKISKNFIEQVKALAQSPYLIDAVLVLAVFLSIETTILSLAHGFIVAYGDAESHLNIPKRVVDSLTPGFAQLGGIWLPLPHLLMIPFVKIEFLYRTGLAGSIVSGISFIVASIFIYKLGYFLTKNRFAGFVAFLVFVTNPNMLYLQSTPMTEPVLICFFVLSSYYFIRFARVALRGKHKEEIDVLESGREVKYLLLASFFGFCASISRYDGWFLVLVEAALIPAIYLPYDKYSSVIEKAGKVKGVLSIIKHKLYLTRKNFTKLQGLTVLFATLAFLGIVGWFAWDGLILGDPFYFKDSQYSAEVQQQAWLKRNELPAMHNLPVAFGYYYVDTMANVGVVFFDIALVGSGYYLIKKRNALAFVVSIVLMIPFIFNVISLFLGQSVIFIPELTPASYEWRLFNVRYGILMLPGVAIFVGYLFQDIKFNGKLLLLFLAIVQFGLYASGYSKIVTLADGINGLSSAKRTGVETWMKSHYDGGLVLMDDYARSVSIIGSGIPMQDVIYVGNKPYWDESMQAPEKYAQWIVIQQNDAVWKGIYTNNYLRGRLYKYFVKVYTSPEVLVFERNSQVSSALNP
ncbi:MAG TPA: hypothetical protein VG965_03500 [Patescibacteria group bacterium]|nr:hypothetical protein [Patescibacteria group bacterium]